MVHIPQGSLPPLPPTPTQIPTLSHFSLNEHFLTPSSRPAGTAAQTCACADTVYAHPQAQHTILCHAAQSGVPYLDVSLQVLVYGDCAVNVEPSAEELALIAVTSAETAAAFGVTPRVAMLSYSTGVSGAGPQVCPAHLFMKLQFRFLVCWKRKKENVVRNQCCWPDLC